jgi:hypothetical protein
MSILIVVGLAAFYPGLLIVLAVAAHPMRRRMFRRTGELLADKRTRTEDRRHLNHLLDSYTSFRVGLLLPIAIIGCTIDMVLARPAASAVDRRWFRDDRRYHMVITSYFLSIAAANPIGPILSIVPLVGMLIVASFKRGAVSARIVEEPLLRAADGLSIAGAAAS